MRDYNERMQEIVRRTEAISRLRRTGTGLPWIVVTEIVYLQLRHILELIATALLVVNEEAVAKLNEPIRRSWHALDILDAILSVNQGFYPTPQYESPKDKYGVGSLVDRKGDYLTIERFRTLYDVCGQIAHTGNPFASKPTIRPRTRKDCERLLRAADKWQARIVRLLTKHVFAIQGSNSLYYAHTVGSPPVFQTVQFEPVEGLGNAPESTPCGAPDSGT